MSATSSIEWTGKTWNPVIGCRRVSPGCEHCYAETMAGRIVRMGGPAAKHYRLVVKADGDGNARGRWNGRFEFVPSALAEPLKWRKPARIFVNSMSDLFGEGVTDEQIAAVFGVMAATPRHTFQVLTKRPERMVEWFRWIAPDGLLRATVLHEAVKREMGYGNPLRPAVNAAEWPLPNVHLGVSVEDQQRADERVPLLLQVPAAVRFLSVEPLLGAVDLARWCWPLRWEWDGRYSTPKEALAAGAHAVQRRQALVSAHAVFLDWAIVGGESGPGARPCDVAWVRSIVEQCRAAQMACFVKQLGADPRYHDLDLTQAVARGEMFATSAQVIRNATVGTPLRLRDKKGGDPSEWPADLRVRQFPEVR